MFEYKPRGVCPNKIRFEIEDNKVRSVKFDGGCNGNLKGIALLVEGMEADRLVQTLKGTKCGSKTSSCPEQLALAVEEALGR